MADTPLLPHSIIFMSKVAFPKGQTGDDIMSKKLLTLFTVLGSLFSQQAVAGSNVTLVVSWRPASNISVPTLSEYGLMMLALLVGALLFKALQSRQSITRSVIAAVGVGTLGAALLTIEEADSGIGYTPTTNQCTGSLNVISDGPTLPPSDEEVNAPAALKNNCGQDVVLSIGECDDSFYTVQCGWPGQDCADSGDILVDGGVANLPQCVD